MNGLIEKVKLFMRGETVRYLFFGVLTVVVNIVSYKLLTLFLGHLTANTLAFFISVLFAYRTNSRFVFRVPYTRKNFVEFMTVRIVTLPVDDGGLWLLLALGMNDMFAKFLVSVLIIVINYIMSKWVVFRK